MTKASENRIIRLSDHKKTATNCLLCLADGKAEAFVLGLAALQNPDKPPFCAQHDFEVKTLVDKAE